MAFCFLQLVKQAMLPRVHGLALKTTVAAVCEHLCLPVIILNLNRFYDKCYKDSQFMFDCGSCKIGDH